MSRNKPGQNGRATRAAFIGIPCHVADSQAFIALSQMARALYVDMRRQYNGRNNGDICAADTVLASYGWAHTSIHKGLKAIIAHGLMVQTRRGGIGARSNTCSLYAFTDRPIIANPATGVAAAAPSYAYRAFQPKTKPKRKRKSTVKAQSERQGTQHAFSTATIPPLTGTIAPQPDLQKISRSLCGLGASE